MSQQRITTVLFRLALAISLLLVVLVAPVAAAPYGSPPHQSSGPDPVSTSQTLVETTPADNATPGQNVTFTATVTPSVPVPTGAVQFKVDGSNYGVPVSLVAGQATMDTTGLPMGDHTVSASYSGDVNFTSSGSNSVNLHVGGSVEIKLLADRDIIPAGWVIHYTIRITNNTGSSGFFAVTDILPAAVKVVSFDGGGMHSQGRIMWKIAVADGATRNLHVAVRPYTTLRGNIVNRAIVAWGTADSSDRATKIVTITAP